ncbi:esterase/lipase family protein [Dactylosporangium sp. CA-233914]|uniref:esterase/lipase family protein n=1 Tax=Dactylosporangium sp. CA-233914 TaxID=3239934 RepID=UPI003D8E98DD
MSEDQIAAAERQAGFLTIADPLTAEPSTTTAVPEHDVWDLPNGFAWVFPGDNQPGIVKPIVMADGFNLGRSDLEWLYQGLEGNYPLISALRQRGMSVILVGFQERTASILDNARTVQAAVMRTIAERLGGHPLTVGGFSMGGLITRYTLARFETERMDHQTRTYFSWDTPHRGASIPVGVQAFAHFIPLANAFARQMNSPAARQMLWQHYDPGTGAIRPAPERQQFLDELRRVGDWPRIPRLLGVANGSGDGSDLKIPAGDTALSVARLFPGTTFHIQPTGRDAKVAYLKRTLPPARKTITTSGFPEIDNAPGGTLDTFEILAGALAAKGATVDLRHPTVCFVPTISAISAGELARTEDLYTNVNGLAPERSDFEDFRCSSTNTGHTAITRELGEWLVERIAA